MKRMTLLRVLVLSVLLPLASCAMSEDDALRDMAERTEEMRAITERIVEAREVGR